MAEDGARGPDADVARGDRRPRSATAGRSVSASGITGITLPFALPTQSIWTGLGIIGAWLAAILGLSYYVRRWIGIATWRWLHRWTLLAYVLCLGHSIGSGTDARSVWMLVLLGAVTLPVIVIGGIRLRGVLGGRAASPAAAVRPSAPASQLRAEI